MAWPETAHVLTVVWTLVVTLIVQVRGTGVFELHLESFRNEFGVVSNGSCCSGIRLNGTCTSTCRTFFMICLKEYQAHISLKPPCTFGSVTSPVIGANSFRFPDSVQAFTNPVRLPFEFTWPGDFTLIITAWHDKTLNGPSPGSPRDMIFQLATQRSVAVGEKWHQNVYSSNSTSSYTSQLRYSYRVICDENYFGDNCSEFCKPRDDKFGHYICGTDGARVCLDGWKGDYCDEAICLPGCDPENGYCKQPNECQCRNGWKGKHCNECIPYPGCLHGTCDKPWQCNCQEGWGGLFCNQDLNYCTNNRPCQNGATCTNTGQGGYTCACAPGYTGTNCEREINDCLYQPCLNGGSCTDIGNDFVCQCPQGFNGKHCESSASSCEESPCKNSAVCIPQESGYKCICPEGYSGVNCEEEIYECASQPCLNGGSCVDDLGGYHCVCRPGFSGSRCQNNSNDCSMNPCQNGATCLDRINDFECRCVPGFVGPLCNINVDDCLTYPCANEGICQDLVNDFICTCPPGFTGKDCSQNIDDCATNPCQHGGTCTDRVNDYQCTCPSGYFGKSCEYIEGQPTPLPTSVPLSKNEPSTRPPSSVPGRENGLNGTKVIDQSPITLQQLLLIVCLGVGIPIIVITVIIVFILCNRRRRNHDDSVHMDNEQNEITNMNNKNRKLDTNVISNLHSTAHQCLKIMNEEQGNQNKKLDNEFNYSAAVCSSSSGGGNSNICHHHLNVDKPCTKNKNYVKDNINKQNITNDLLVHSEMKRPSSSQPFDYSNPQDKGRPSVDNSVPETSEYSSDLKPPNAESQGIIFFVDSHCHPHRGQYSEGMLATEV